MTDPENARRYPVYNDAQAAAIIMAQVAPLVAPHTLQSLLDVLKRDELLRVAAFNRVSAFQPGWPVPLETAVRENAQ